MHSGLLGFSAQMEEHLEQSHYEQSLHFEQLEHFEQSVNLTLIVTVAQSVFPSLPFTQYLKLSVQDLLQLLALCSRIYRYSAYRPCRPIR